MHSDILVLVTLHLGAGFPSACKAVSSAPYLPRLDRLPQDGLKLRGFSLARVTEVDFVVPAIEVIAMRGHVFLMQAIERRRFFVV